MRTQSSDIPIVILAGGAGSRMGGLDKCLLEVGGKTILSRIQSTLSKQTAYLFLNVNGDSERFKPINLSIIQDQFTPPIGPIGGLFSAINEVSTRLPDAQWIVTVTGDSPFVPTDISSRLMTSTDENTEVVYCKSGGRDHFATALWSLKIKTRLQSYIHEGNRSMGKFIAQLNTRTCEFESAPHDPFFNINTHEQWQHAQSLLEKLNP